MRATLCAAALLVQVAWNVAHASEVAWTDPTLMLRDGDSGWIVSADGEVRPIRLVDFDTPEISGWADCPEESVHGIRAGAEAQRIVTNRRIEIEWIDADSDGETDQGPYDRYLGRVHLLDDTGARVSTLYAELVRPGLALPYGGTGRRPDWCRYIRFLQNR